MSFNTKRLGVLTVGLFVDRLMIWFIDLWLYPVVILTYGEILGGGVMIYISFLACVFSIVVYDYMRIDWLGIEASKEAAKFVETGLKRSFMQVSRFILLSLAFDPFWTVIYMRDGSNQFNGLTRRDWKVFIASLLVSNLFWIVVTATSLKTFEGSIGKTMLVLAGITLVLPVVRRKLTKAIP